MQANQADDRRIPGAETVLYSFSGGSDGTFPDTDLVNVGDAFYGATSEGGASGCSGGCGTIFKVAMSGAETVIYNLQGGPDGANPEAGLINLGGALYGTTFNGGGTECLGFGCGTVFKIETSGRNTDTVLHRFGVGATASTDGTNPDGKLLDVGGTLYGTTYGTTTDDNAPSRCMNTFALGCGTIFKVTTSGVETVLYRFGGGADGDQPNAGLLDVGGTLYGTTFRGGGTGCRGVGCGTVFEVTPSGAEKVIYRFMGGSDGAGPEGSLVNVGGTLYGTTSFGGSGCGGSGCGTVFAVTPSGTETVLHRFGGRSDGKSPVAGLINVGSTLYGTTSSGGINAGTVFKITTSGAESVLYTFKGPPDGSQPQSGLLNVGNMLYGTTVYGGDKASSCDGYGCGTVFSIQL